MPSSRLHDPTPMVDPQHSDSDPAAVDAASADMESTAELAQRARDGDREALDQLFGQYIAVARGVSLRCGAFAAPVFELQKVSLMMNGLTRSRLAVLE